MSILAVKKWVEVAFDNSTLVAGSYPRQASDGVLFNAGFSNSRVTILPYRTVYNLDLTTEAAIVIEFPDSNQDQKTGMGANGQITDTHEVILNVLWMSNTGNESTNDDNFNILVDAVKETFNKSVYRMMSSSDTQGANWPITDIGPTHKQSRIVGNSPSVKTSVYPPVQTEDSKNILYTAVIQGWIKETYQLIP